jgi:copper homeostasis protein
MKLLEVIVTSTEEATEAEQGGANRLEVVRDLQHEGLTPPVDLVEEILKSVSIPIRVMLRDIPAFSAIDTKRLNLLTGKAAYMVQLPISGFVLGFIKSGAIDLHSVQHMLDVIGSLRVTFHRAIEHVSDQSAAVEQLKAFPNIDRILVNGGSGSWHEKREVLERLQKSAAPEITVIAGGGLNERSLKLFSESPLLNEFHVGKAARNADGKVVSARVAALRHVLDA